MRRAGSSPTANANDAGPLPEIEQPNAPASSAADFASTKPGRSGDRAGSAIRSSIERRRRSKSPLASAATRAPTAAAWARATGSGTEGGRRTRASWVRRRLLRRDDDDPELCREGEPHDVDRIHAADQDDPSEERGGHVVGVTTGHDPLGVETGLEQIFPPQRRTQQLVHGDRGRDRRSGASSLSAREREALRDVESQSDRGRRRHRAHPRGGDARRVPFRIERNLGMSGRMDLDVPVRRASRRHRVSRARDGEREDVEARSDVRHGPRREDTDALHPPASSRTSFRIPAAVTPRPAPGPWMTRGFAR